MAMEAAADAAQTAVPGAALRGMPAGDGSMVRTARPSETTPLQSIAENNRQRGGAHVVRPGNAIADGGSISKKSGIS